MLQSLHTDLRRDVATLGAAAMNRATEPALDLATRLTPVSIAQHALADLSRVIARQLRALGRTVSLLILMEQRAFPLYEGPIALIFGKESAFNPYQPGADPEAGFRQSYPAGFTVDIIAGAHGQFFEPPNIDTLAATLKRRLTDRSSGAATDDPLHGSPLFKSPGQP